MKRINPVLLLTIGLPAVAVLASFATLAVTLTHPESELPEQYHWEGFQLDRDFSRAERATQLDVRAEVTGLDQGGACALILSSRGVAPQTLRLTMAHATMPSRDSHLEFHRLRSDSDGSTLYSGRCSALTAGHWRVELADTDGTWSLRDTVQGTVSRMSLSTGASHGE